MIDISTITQELTEVITAVIAIGSSVLIIYVLGNSIGHLRDALGGISEEITSYDTERNHREYLMFCEDEHYARTGEKSARLQGIAQAESKADSPHRSIDKSETRHEHRKSQKDYSRAYK